MTDQDATGAHMVPQVGAPKAELADWRELLELRRFNAAKQAYLVAAYAATGRIVTEAEGDDDAVRSALTALADVEDLLRERRYAKAGERLERLEHKPPLAPWHDLLADLAVLAEVGKALDKRDPDQALTELERLTSTWFAAEASTLRGTAQAYLGESAAAKASFEAAVAFDPKHYRALTNLGNVALEEGDVDGAIERYQAALAVNEEFSNAHHNLGVAYRRKGEVGKSVKHLRRAQRLAYKQDAADARESFMKGSGKRFGGALRWVLWVAIGAAVWWVLRSQGVI
jgi:tetratricopeptide (TPR) repeat protein